MNRIVSTHKNWFKWLNVEDSLFFLLALGGGETKLTVAIAS